MFDPSFSVTSAVRMGAWPTTSSSETTAAIRCRAPAAATSSTASIRTARRARSARSRRRGSRPASASRCSRRRRPAIPARLFIVEKRRQIQILDLDDAAGPADAVPRRRQRRSSTNGERGLLGLAFDPDFASNGYFYVNLTNPSGDTEIRRYQVSAADPNRRRSRRAQTLILAIDQPDGLTNHKAGWLGFGPDGYLYTALGDGGGGGDPTDNGQNIDSLLGKILRLDVTATTFPPTRRATTRSPPTIRSSASPAPTRSGRSACATRGATSFDRGLGDSLYRRRRPEQLGGDQPRAGGRELRLGRVRRPDAVRRRARLDRRHPRSSRSTPTAHSVGAIDHRRLCLSRPERRPARRNISSPTSSTARSSRCASTAAPGSPPSAPRRSRRMSARSLPASFGEDALGNLYVVDLDGEVFRLTPNVVSADQADTSRRRRQRHAVRRLGQRHARRRRRRRRVAGRAGADKLVGASGGDI